MLFNSTEPDFINSEGTQYWYDLEGCEYLESRGFTNIISWCIQPLNSAKCITLINNSTNKIVAKYRSFQELIEGISQL